jgi:hypothetical protein
MTAARAPQYFFIIGAMKAGTTSLYKYLSGHPDLYPSPRKEPRVFKDAGDLASVRAAFLTLFEGRRDERWCFEASTAYTKYPRVRGVPRRLEAVAPEARFIYLVRNPVERAWSHYLHNLAHGREPRPFARAVQERPQYLNISRYYLQMEQYHEVFPRDRILVQVFEEMVKAPGATVRAVCEFLDVDTSYQPSAAGLAYNASSTKRSASRSLRAIRALGVDELVPWRIQRRLKAAAAPLPAKEATLTPEFRAVVVDSLRDDTDALFKLLGRQISSWTDFA